MKEEILNWLRKLISIPSPSGEEGRLGKEIGEFLKKIGFKVEFQEVFPARENVIGRRGESGLLLCTHLDTIPPFDHPTPYELRIEYDKAIGRGAVDTKGQLASLLVALSHSSAPCQVALTVDEEKEGRGSAILKVEAENAIVLEPTDLQIAISQAGALEYELEIRGKSAHSATPEYGENAILKAISLFNELYSLSFMRATHPLFPPPSINLALIEGGVEPTVVPPLCKMQIDIQILPSVNIEEAKKEVEDFFVSRGVSFSLLDIAPPYELKEMPKVGRLLDKFLKKEGRESAPVGMRSWTDAENLYRKGIPSIVYGAGELGIAHSAREWVRLDDLEFLTYSLIWVLENYQ